MGKEQLSDYYDNSYHSKRHKNLLQNDKYFWAKSKTSYKLYFSEFNNDLKVLEFGVGIGQNIASLNNAYGFDISKEALDACRKRNIPVFDTIDSVPDNEFDIVLSRHSLEHVPNPLESLIQMRSKLNDKGTLLLILPKENHGKASFEPDLNNHLFSWNFRAINNLLNLAGFKPIRNIQKYSMGFKLLLPLYGWVGLNFYLTMVKIVGRLTGQNGELIIHAMKKN